MMEKLKRYIHILAGVVMPRCLDCDPEQKQLKQSSDKSFMPAI